MKENNKGFTLIELLVVVLIIGILAAIALPQYQLSVDKSKLAGYHAIAKALADGYERYRLVHFDGPYDINMFDVGLPEGYIKVNPDSGGSCAVFDDSYCCANSPIPGRYGSIICGKADNKFALQLIRQAPSGSDSFRRVCFAKDDNHRAIRLCKNICGELINNALMTQNGFKSGYKSCRILGH